jgi:hypothetical protein
MRIVYSDGVMKLVPIFPADKERLMNGCILLSAIICYCSLVSGQIRVRPGIAIGYSSYTQTVDPPSMYAGKNVGRPGFTGGAVCEISVLKLVSIEPGIFYSMRGSRSEGDVVADDVRHEQTISTRKFSYIAFPVHIKINYPTPLIHPYALAGLNIGILLEATELDEVIDFRQGRTDSEEFGRKYEFDANDFGVDLGAGVQADISVFSPFVEFVYYVGLRKLEREKADYRTTKNAGWEIKAGSKLRL